jgi:hypothetical protein
MTISISPELSSALTRAALRSHTNISKQIEVFLRENQTVSKYIKEIREEYEPGALAASPAKNRSAKSSTKPITITSS